MAQTVFIRRCQHLVRLFRVLPSSSAAVLAWPSTAQAICSPATKAQGGLGENVQAARSSWHMSFAGVHIGLLCSLTWQASLSILVYRMHLPLNIPLMHTDLQGMPMAIALALTECLSSKDGSLIAGPTLACLLKSCRNSGTKSSTCTWATFLSSLAAIARSGGRVTSVQMAFLTSGRQLLLTGPKGQAVLSALAGLFVNTTRLPERHLKLRCFGMPKRIIPCHQTK